MGQEFSSPNLSGLFLKHFSLDLLHIMTKVSGSINIQISMGLKDLETRGGG